MLRFGKREFYGAKIVIKILHVNVDNTVISKLVTTKNLLSIGLDIESILSTGLKVIRPLVLILTKMSGYVETFKDKDGEKNQNDKLMSFCKYDGKLLQKYKTIFEL